MSEEQKNAPETEPMPDQSTPQIDDPLGTLAGQMDEITKARNELQERLLLAQAEFENYRKRSQKEQDQERQYRSLPIVRDLLPVMDNLRRALEASSNSAQSADKLVEGVRMVVQQFEDILGKHSIMPIPAVGQPFNPNLHEALTQAPSADHPPMTVLMEVERGYQLFERIVRPAKVIVSIAPPA